jgi:hypothetical protein
MIIRESVIVSPAKAVGASHGASHQRRVGALQKRALIRESRQGAMQVRGRLNLQIIIRQYGSARLGHRLSLGHNRGSLGATPPRLLFV